MRLVVVGASYLAILIAANGAQAAQRYASPTGSGEACSQTTPCSLFEAIGKAKSNDEVIVTAGTYPLGATSITAPPAATGLNIHGDLGGPMPKLVATIGQAVIELGQTGDRLGYLEIVNSGVRAVGVGCGNNSLIDRVKIAVTGEGSFGVEQRNTCAVRDSVLQAEGKEAIALYSAGFGETAVARNLTALASGEGSVGVSSNFDGGFSAEPHTVDLKNTIARGTGADLAANFFFIPFPISAEGSGNIDVSNSNFAVVKQEPPAAVAEGAGNQSAAPLFVNAAASDYREAAGSPTIDAGVADQLGPLDLGGNPRVLGAAPDIGAYELVPPLPAGGGGVRSLSIKPKRFRAYARGGPVAPAILKSRPPVGAEVTYTLSGPATVEFSVSRKVRGRRVGKRCEKKTHANAGQRKCAFFTPLPGVFTQAGVEGANHFVFSGRIGGKTLHSGSYALTALAGHLVSAPFEIGGLRRHHRRS
jgi:hypothetical protein